MTEFLCELADMVEKKEGVVDRSLTPFLSFVSLRAVILFVIAISCQMVSQPHRMQQQHYPHLIETLPLL